VRVGPDYLRAMVAPLREPNVGAVTCFYVHADHHSFVDRLQTAGMISDFYAGILVAWQLDGIKFALGPSIATTRTRLAAFGGYASIENRPADDLLVGRLIAEQGYEVKLLRYSVLTVSDYRSLRDLFHKRLRWIVVMRHMRPAGHLGLLFTHGFAWCLLAVIVQPTIPTAAAYFGTYIALRAAITWMIGVHGLRQPHSLRQVPLIPLWDAIAFVIWLASFTQSSVRWRGANYYIRDGRLVPVASVAKR
jgi:ceramide glucosyltransferase